MNDQFYMALAIEEARKAYDDEEIPIGAIIIKNDAIIATGRNENRKQQNPVKHAEINAIEQACLILNNERLPDCELYVTKEPCSMCAGAIVHARIKRLIIGTKDPKYGACGTVLSICGNNKLNHVPIIKFGVMEEDCRELLQRFFQGKRGMQGNGTGYRQGNGNS